MKSIHLLICLSGLLAPPALAQSILPATNPKVRVATAVFQQLNYAFGTGRSTGLRLEMLARSSRKKPIVAQYTPRPGGSVIRLDEEVYDVCQTLGPDSRNALAVILGHELAHHHLNHSWYDTFGLSGKSGAGNSVEQIRRFETEADFYGCFIAQLCGYAPNPAFPKVLALIYNRFTLPDQIRGYVARIERPSAYAQKAAQLPELASLFRVAQLLYATGRFDAAAVCFQRLTNADAFPNAPMLNNLSVCYLQAYNARINANDQPFALPIEFDVNGRLATPRSRGETPSPALLSAAIRTLETALSAEHDYSTARLNLACAYLLNHKYNAALGEIDRITPRQHTAETWLVQAIAFHFDGQNDRAKIAFQKARQQQQSATSAAVVTYNQKIFEARAGSAWEIALGWLRQRFLAPSHPPAILITTEQIGGQRAETMSIPTSQTAVTITGFDETKQRSLQIEWLGEPRDGGILAGKLQTTGGQSLQLLVAGSAYRGKMARQIGIGYTATQLQAAYGQPVRQFRQTGGSWWVYESVSRNRQLIVELTAADRVQGWILAASP